ncbi:hypothetical protein WN51_00094 [Melipona quadrifasciata]|uniref:Uncharacterized protein n=1 Tax=Melipona quadrifasciata TaxID=166423 RepID=A0A0M9ABK4_9HYME|nr:hypothetical protein WN51_00094 [Melipona quadrifasciata]
MYVPTPQRHNSTFPVPCLGIITHGKRKGGAPWIMEQWYCNSLQPELLEIKSLVFANVSSGWDYLVEYLLRHSYDMRMISNNKCCTIIPRYVAIILDDRRSFPRESLRMRLTKASTLSRQYGDDGAVKAVRIEDPTTIYVERFKGKGPRRLRKVLEKID